MLRPYGAANRRATDRTCARKSGDAAHIGRIMVRPVDHESLLIVLSTGGSPLDDAALDVLADTVVQWVRVEREGDAACLAARVRHADPPDRFRERVRAWGAARGWAVTVASSRRPG